ncbi:hypothetical protein [Desulfogranum marinum]|nr:hypothetical protein [Desulfogranum marinum]
MQAYEGKIRLVIDLFIIHLSGEPALALHPKFSSNGIRIPH